MCRALLPRTVTWCCQLSYVYISFKVVMSLSSLQLYGLSSKVPTSTVLNFLRNSFFVNSVDSTQYAPSGRRICTLCMEIHNQPWHIHQFHQVKAMRRESLSLCKHEKRSWTDFNVASKISKLSHKRHSAFSKMGGIDWVSVPWISFLAFTEMSIF